MENTFLTLLKTQQVFNGIFLVLDFCFIFNLVAAFIADGKIGRLSFFVADIHNNVSPLTRIRFSFQPFILEIKESSLLRKNISEISANWHTKRYL
jgi:hypothetical protein